MQDIIVAAVASRQDMELVGRVCPGDAEDALSRLEPDAVILTEAEIPVDAIAPRLLGTHPRLKIVVVAGDGSAARLIELRQSKLVDPSPTTLLDTIRAAIAQSAGDGL